MTKKLKILIDGDACNILNKIENIAKNRNIPCHIFCDTTRIIKTEYSRLHIVDESPDSADFAILKKCNAGDIIITNDSGLAAMALARHAYVLNTHGFEYDDKNIMIYLTKRHIRQKQKAKLQRDQVKGILPGGAKRQNFTKLLTATIDKSERNQTNA